MNNYRPGELDQRIIIRREVLTDNGMGGQDIDLKIIANCISSHVRQLSAKESERFDKLNATGINLFVVRYRNDVREDDRIEWGGEEYNIRSVTKNGGRKLYTEIFAERGVAM